MPTSATQTYQEFKTADSRWTYGYAEYKKAVVQLNTPPVSAPTTITSAWPTAAVIQDAISQVAAVVKTAIPTVKSYYIFAVGPDGVKRIAGEWTLLQGGRAPRDTYFNTNFEPAMNVAGINDLVVAAIIVPAAQAAPGLPVVETLKKILTAEIQAAVAATAAGTGSSVLWLVGAALVAAYFIFRK